MKNKYVTKVNFLVNGQSKTGYKKILDAKMNF